ncbi:hypothetical protein K227x_48290 [Rubripirellula lacrimiformis]|uniref:Uncharacterized protein n=1 Tax=Rubripirellula lacrimiformis TaxID=1930273 RepID=A0A517NH04_9BACT|nr:DUF58 domain-containing protein [Rubripirellula lacrimiformis]QDT06419.1 hypothetical protein K227x_48290 [Rubripirellula lacrimiformis]
MNSHAAGGFLDGRVDQHARLVGDGSMVRDGSIDPSFSGDHEGVHAGLGAGGRLGIRSVIGWGLRFGSTLVLLPIRGLRSLRRSMTGASVTLLLIGIVSLNIVWGYPWSGIFAATVTMLVAGWIINRWMRPQLRIGFSLPSAVPVGQSFPVAMHLRNVRRFPAMDLSVHFESPSAGRRRVNPPVFESSQHRESLSMIRPYQRRDVAVSMTGNRRGVHRLPAVMVESMFPFHLFRSTQRSPVATEIAITPQLLSADEDPIARGLLDALGGWSHRLLAGDALDYTGSREYQVGMPVRRWDFTSWARLGRPIVREFQSPSIQMVTIIIDTGRTNADRGATTGTRKSKRSRLPWSRNHLDQQVDRPLERMLSLAAVAVESLCQRQVRVRLYATSESLDSFASPRSLSMVAQNEPLLIQLASAKRIGSVVAAKRVQEVVEQLGRSPILCLTTRPHDDASLDLPPHVTMIRVDDVPAHDDVAAETSPSDPLVRASDSIGQAR